MPTRRTQPSNKESARGDRHPLFVKQTHGLTPYLTIGKVAAIAGASPKAIRHYEELGLIPPPRRRGKYRVYSEQDVFLVHVLKHSQSLGFKLYEVKDLIDEKITAKRFPIKLANRLFERKRQQLEAEIAGLREMLDRLELMRREMNQRFGA